MTTGAILILVVSIVGGVALLLGVLFLVFSIVLKKGRAKSEKILKKFEGQNIVAQSLDANYFGQESLGTAQLRGNGCLVLTDTELYFEMWVGDRQLRVPRANLRGGETVKWFLNKTKGVPILKVNFINDAGAEDAAGWIVRDPQEWISKLSA